MTTDAASAPTIFVTDPSAEAERVAHALRTNGHTVVDVPSSMLIARMAAQMPNLVLYDADTEGAAETLSHIVELAGDAPLAIVALGAGVRLPDEMNDPRAQVTYFARPVDVAAVVRAVEQLTGTASEPRRPSSPPKALPSSRPPMSQLPSISPRAGVPAVRNLPDNPLPARVSPSLERLLGEAEARVLADVPSEPHFPSPEEELQVVLPADLLNSLDEPLDEEEEDEVEPVMAVGNSPTTSAGGRQLTTGAGREGSADGRMPSEHGTGVGVSADTNASKRTTGTMRPGVSAVPPPSRLANAPRTEAPPSRLANAARTDAPPSRLGNAPRTEAPPSRLANAARTDAPPSRLGKAPPRIETPLSIPRMDAVLEPSEPSFGVMSIPAARPAADVVEVLGNGGEGVLRALAESVATRRTGAICVDAPGGVRRIVLFEGDMVTAASGIDSESLVAFLVSRGDLRKTQVDRLLGKLPPYGRHAGAALVAQGFLGQDDLWTTLRGHAEWIVGRALVSTEGPVTFETELAGRLKNEPSVFGGATGASVFVDIVRRVISPDLALERLGGPHGRLAPGPRAQLLSECSLEPKDTDLVTWAEGRSVAEMLARSQDGDLASLVLALRVLGIVDVIRAVADARASLPEPVSSEMLDVEAVRARVQSRLELVEEGDYFEILGVTRDATNYEVRRAFLELRRAFEPARFQEPDLSDLRDAVAKIALVLDEAYEILHDPARRDRYRRALEPRAG